MRREFRNTEEPAYNAICFHAQQCIEKLLKGFLQENRIYFPKTHDIQQLIELTSPVRPEWEKLIGPASVLTRYAIDSRYPDDEAYREDAEEAVAVCEKLRRIILDALEEFDQLRLQ
ncbi:MAG TPA: HEPN domain-containing protein [Candidatus Kapabacteria bacterium]|nr:HEPN domain-containing protein [Candidatus Kapabacteria bacterium]